LTLGASPGASPVTATWNWGCKNKSALLVSRQSRGAPAKNLIGQDKKPAIILMDHAAHNAVLDGAD